MIEKPANLLWIDLEMTGLDPVEDRIMEVAAIATDWELNELASIEAVVKVKPKLVQERMEVGRDFWDANIEARDGLVQQNIEKGEAIEVVEDKLAKFIKQHFNKGDKVLLAGNSIHQDRKFIDNEWPSLSKMLHYRMLDVSAWKVVFEGRYKKKFSKPEQHRALEDIRGSIEELKYYLMKVEA